LYPKALTGSTCHTPQATPNQHLPKARFKDPDSFAGDHKGNESHKNQEEFRVWKRDIALKLEMDGDVYPTERDKFIYVAGCTTGSARKNIDPWVTGTLEGKPNGVTSWKNLVSILERIYDVADRSTAAEREMAKLEQKNQPFMAFFTQFNALLNDLEWNDEAKVAALRSKISYEMSSALIPIVNLPPKKNYSDWVTLLCRLAENLEAHSQRKHPKSTAATTRQTQEPLLQQLPSPDPMILDAMKLTPQERIRRIQNRLCLYCGKAGHVKLTCPEAAAARAKRGHTWQRNPQPSQNNSYPRTDHRLRALGWNDTASVSSESLATTPAFTPLYTPRSITPTPTPADEQLKEQPTA
jgi:Retrotransposon gag protein